MITVILTAALLVAICMCWGSCKRWQYKECMAVGHSKTYCIAQTAGCFSGNKRRK